MFAPAVPAAGESAVRATGRTFRASRPFLERTGGFPRGALGLPLAALLSACGGAAVQELPLTPAVSLGGMRRIAGPEAPPLDLPSAE